MKHTFPYADMHCDTLTELYHAKSDINSSELQVSLDYAESFSPYVQIGAVWTDNKLSDVEAYNRFFEVVEHFKTSPSVLTKQIMLCNSEQELEFAIKHGTPAFILAVEGARIFASSHKRFYEVTDCGVRLITLQWADSDCIGGAWNTNLPLTDFGLSLLPLFEKAGIAVDVSHASDAVTEQVLDYCENTSLKVCASHSNSRSVCHHKRNLTDEQFLRIKKLGGIVGISMAPEHLNNSGTADSNDVCRHIMKYLELGGEDTVCFGCDFDGIASTPAGIKNQSSISYLRKKLLRLGLTEKILNKIFFDNAYSFIKGILYHT